MTLATVQDVFSKMPDVFDADAAQGLDAVFQFEITGDNGGSWNIAVKDGTCEILEGLIGNITAAKTNLAAIRAAL